MRPRCSSRSFSAFVRLDGSPSINSIRQVVHLAFPPQALVARFPGFALRVEPGISRGLEAGTPDRGFYTQVCPGDRSMLVIELEQMSPLYRAGESAEFTMWMNLATD